MWARGAIDNKAHGIMALMTMLALKRNGVALRRGVEMMVNPDEEAGGENGASWMVKNHWDAIDPAFAFNEGGDGTPDWLGLKGITFQVAVSEKRVNWLHVTRPRQGRARLGAEARQPESHFDQRAASTARKSAADSNHENFRRRDGIRSRRSSRRRRRSNSRISISPESRKKRWRACSARTISRR